MAEPDASGSLPPWEEPADRELADAAARARILTELDRNLVVEAAAGAGKTHALVGRIVALLASGRCAVDQVAAVTFTRKAAGELRGRLLTRIEGSLERLEEAPAEHEEAIGNLRAAMDGFERAFAGTIHSFCARLLRERPVEAGVDPGFEEMDERDATTLRREAWEEHVDRESEGPSPRLERLEEAGIDPEDLLSTFEMLCRYPEVEIPREAAPAPDLEGPADRVREFVEWALERVPDVPVEDRHDALQGKLFAARSFLRNRELDSPAARAEFLKLFDGGTGQVLKLWGDRDVGRSVRDRFEALEEEVIAPALADWRAFCYPVVLDFVEPAVEQFERLRQRRGVLDFQDLLLRAARLLRREPRVRRHFARRYPRILVDEFQDTDPLQAEILFLLTGTDRRETDWRRLEPRPGSLFLVGDPKQSIYRFRRADVDVYRFVRDRIAETGGEVVGLQTSFRSLRPLVEWLNGSLRPILEAHDRDVQPPFVPLAPYRRLEGPAAGTEDGDADEGPLVRRLAHGKVHRNRPRRVAENDARAIARWIRAAVDGEAGDALPGASLAPGDALVLLRQKKHLDLYARALEEQGLPYEVSGGGAVGDSEELAHLLGMAEAALHPDDPVALAAYLRGPLVGLSDDALYRFRTGGGVWDYGAYARRGRPLPEVPERDHLQEAFVRLHRAYRWLNQLAPAAALEKIMWETGVLAHAAGLEAGSSRAGSLYRVLSLVREWQARGREVAWILEELRSLAEGEGPEVDEMVLEAGRGDAVRVMNLHKAKGLQGRVVFLADPLKKSDGRVTAHIERVERGGEAVEEAGRGGSPRGHFRVARRNRHGSITDELALPPDWEEIESLEGRYQEAEEARLLYVAATRARDLLVVSHYPHSNRDQPWGPFDPALEEVPALDVPSGAGESPAADPSPGEAVAPPDAAAVEERRRRLRRASYEIVQPSDVDETEPVAGGRPSGTPRDAEAALSYGHVVHEALRAMAEGGEAPDREGARRLLEEAGGDPEAAAGVVGALRRVRESWFWGELEAADRVLAEVRFGRWLAGGRAEDAAGGPTDEAAGDGSLPALERGAVDLAYRREDGWVIVDYKTHRVAGDADLDDLAERLAPQVAAYREAWEAISGEPVARAGLFFTRSGAWREVGAG